MARLRISSAALLVMLAVLALFSTSCFAGNSETGSSTRTSEAITPAVIRPKPKVERVVATTSGTSSSYYVTLEIKVKNEGAKGSFLVIANVTQDGKTSQNQMEVFLKQNESHELELTFPLVWNGGEFTFNVQAVIP